MDPKSKYSSNVAVAYKEHLQDLARQDAALFPDGRVVLAGDNSTGSGDSANKKPDGDDDDFFKDAEALSASGSNRPATLGHLMQNRAASGSGSDSGSNRSLNTSPAKKPLGVKKVVATKASKLGAKKAEAQINFDEIEAKAKEEEKRLAQLELERMEQQMRDAELARERMLQQQQQKNAPPEPLRLGTGSGGINNVAANASKNAAISPTLDKEQQEALERLGMGFGRVNLNMAS